VWGVPAALLGVAGGGVRRGRPRPGAKRGAVPPATEAIRDHRLGVDSGRDALYLPRRNLSQPPVAYWRHWPIAAGRLPLVAWVGARARASDTTPSQRALPGWNRRHRSRYCQRGGLAGRGTRCRGGFAAGVVADRRVCRVERPLTRPPDRHHSRASGASPARAGDGESATRLHPAVDSDRARPDAGRGTWRPAALARRLLR